MPSPARQPPSGTAAGSEEEDESSGDWRRHVLTSTMPTPFVRLTRLPDIVAPNPRSSGFCHSCNRQVQVDLDSFSCAVCAGGFVEFNNGGSGSSESGGSRPQPPSSGSSSDPYRAYQPPRDLLSSLFNDDLSWLSDLGSIARHSDRSAAATSSGGPSIFLPPPPSQSTGVAAETRRPICRHHHRHHHFLSPFDAGPDPDRAMPGLGPATTRRDDEPEAILINIPRILRPLPFADLALLNDSPSSAAASASSAAEAPDSSTAAASSSNRPISIGDASAAVSTGIFAADLASDAVRARAMVTNSREAHHRFMARRSNPDRYSLRSHAATTTTTGVRTRSSHYARRGHDLDNADPSTSAGAGSNEPPPMRRRHRTFRSFSHRMRDEVPMDLDSSNDESDRQRPGADPTSSAADPASRRSR